MSKIPRHIAFKAYTTYQNRDYYLNPYTKKQSALPKPAHMDITRNFEALGITVVPYTIDIDDFKDWLEQVQFPSDYIDSCGDVFVEKALEHYVGASLLQMGRDDTLIDVAAEHSPWYMMAEKTYDCTAYALDLAFESGMHGKKIGADATHMPLPDGFATKMALHCSFEHFEGSADIDLLPEARRVLKDNGRMVILPLYVSGLYFILSSPLTDRRGLDYEGAELVWWDGPYRVRFARNYSVDAFYERIFANLNKLTLTIYHIENESDISSKCYLKYAALFEKCPLP